MKLAFQVFFSAALISASSACERTYGQQACRMNHEAVLAQTRDIPRAVGVMPIDQARFLASWSSDGATFAMLLSELAMPIGRVMRIESATISPALLSESQNRSSLKTFWPVGDRPSIDAEHLAIVPLSEAKSAVLMLEKRSGLRPGGAFAAIVTISPLKVVEMFKIGPAGEYAESISGARLGKDLIVAWHEGLLSRSKVRLSRQSLSPPGLVKEAEIETPNAAASPFLKEIPGGVILAWSETVHRSGTPQSQVMVAIVDQDLKIRNRLIVATTRFLDPAPSLSRTGDVIGLVFRDDADRDETPEYYFTAVEMNLKAASQPKRISQADGWRGPNLIYVQPLFFSAAIRSFQRNLLIGINRFDASGKKNGGEFQIYADKTDFVRVDLARSEENLVMIYAEDRRTNGRVLAGQLSCTDRLNR